MKKFFGFAVILLKCINLSGQSLAIGDKVPDVTLRHLISWQSETARLKDFNTHCLILDFWATYCGTCIDGFAKIEEMQNRFSGKLQVLLVSVEPEKVVRKFFTNRRLSGRTDTSLPNCTSDSILSRLFLHESVPHYVWIDDEGKVYAITGFEEITEQNLDAFVNGVPSRMRQKKDVALPFDTNKPFLINGNGGNGDGFLAHSILSKFVENLTAMVSVINSESSGHFIRLTNMDIRKMYQVAYDKGDEDGGRGLFGFPNSRTFMEMEDSMPYCAVISGQREKENCYCYELRVPQAHSFWELKTLMQEDLNRYFHLRAHVEKRKVPCWILQADDSTIIKTRMDRPKQEIDRYSVDIQDTKITDLIFLLQYDFMPNLASPVIDETGIRGGIDLKLYADLSSPELLNKALTPFKMHFIKQDRLVDVLVLKNPQRKIGDQLGTIQ
jgi:thiol-disulfide isomerase/thioredoxin